MRYDAKCIAKKIDLFSISCRILPQVLHCAPGQAGPGWCHCHCCNRSKPKVCIKSVAATALVQICAVNRNPNDWFKLSEQIRISAAVLTYPKQSKGLFSLFPHAPRLSDTKLRVWKQKLLRDSGHSACSLRSPVSLSGHSHRVRGKPGSVWRGTLCVCSSTPCSWLDLQLHGILFVTQNSGMNTTPASCILYLLLTALPALSLGVWVAS